jgi:3-hydroxyisobutyrate dehydrogenase-like beta-hydroxyacid dehydrogenase
MYSSTEQEIMTDHEILPAGLSATPGSNAAVSPERWLIIGHGTVGATLLPRVVACGATACVYDPDPRLTPPELPAVTRVAAHDRVRVDHVAVCVPASAGAAVSAYLHENVDGDPLVYDWASAPPDAKISNASAERRWIDVALLDSLDRVVDRPLLAISGPAAEEAAAVLRALGFEVAVAGTEVGQAAAVKITRSLFMKPLEALIVEFRSIASALDPAGASWLSIHGSLGTTFGEFADVLVSSDAVHSERRAAELRHALTYAGAHGWNAGVAQAAEQTLARLAEHWGGSSITPETSVPDLLTDARRVFAE